MKKIKRLFLEFKRIFLKEVDWSKIDFYERRVIVNMDLEFISECS